MDYISHGIWSYIFFHKIKIPIYAVLFGLLPDTVSWGVLLIYNLFTGQFSLYLPGPFRIPEWFFTLYGVSHSLIVFIFVVLIVYLVFKKVPIYIFAWSIAIVIDILTHAHEYLATPFLWPVSEWKFTGINWEATWFNILNFSLIVLFLILIYVKKKRRKNVDF